MSILNIEDQTKHGFQNPNNVSKRSAEEVGEWSRSLNLSQDYYDDFVNCKIDGEALLMIDNSNLYPFMKIFGDQLKLLNAISKLKGNLSSHSNWKENLSKNIKSPIQKKDDYDEDVIEFIGETFDFMNREAQLTQIYYYFEDRYKNYDKKFGENHKLAFKSLCCFAASGMGKTTLFSKGIEKMILMFKNELFTTILKKVNYFY